MGFGDTMDVSMDDFDWDIAVSGILELEGEDYLEKTILQDYNKKSSLLSTQSNSRKRTRESMHLASDTTLEQQMEVNQPQLRVARRVYVGNLAWKTSWQDLKDHFAQIGTVKYADVLREAGPGSRSKGCGIVEFDSAEHAILAIQSLNHTELDGRNIFIREDREDYELRAADDGPTFKRKKPGIAMGPVSIGRRVYVGNLGADVSWKDLKDHFKVAGHVVHADILSNTEGNSKGCGIVEFSTAAEALRAISHLSNSVLNGRQIMVREDREDPSTDWAQKSHMGQEGTQIVIHGIPYRMAWQDLKDLARQAGHVVRADIATNPDGSSKGYGIIQYATPQDASTAIALLNGQVFEGRIITVKYDRFVGQ